MGGTPSKPAPPPVSSFVPDFSRATLTGEDLMRQTAQFTATAQAQAKKAIEDAKAATTATYMLIAKGIGGLIVVVGIVLAVLAIHDAIVRQWGGQTFILPGLPAPSSAVGPSDILVINSATYGGASNPTDVTAYLRTQVQNNGGVSLPSFTVGAAAVGISTPPTSQNTLTVHWTYGYGSPNMTSAVDGAVFPKLPTSGAPVSQQRATAPVKAPLFGGIWNMFGSSSGNLMSSLHDATTTTTVPAASAPLSSENQGNYGAQWWMFVKDWNYGYGKEKSVIYRPDASNASVANPNISLHPTDNTLRVSVSIFPSSEGGSGKSEPAPAGHSGSSDDVFVCDVPNIPLQAWFSVSTTVFERNLDIYIDGKLVKSCFLPGVPKPAVGDIQIAKDGGFSGYMCGFTHYPRMLTPDDAISFFTAGTPCSSQTGPSATAAATGYSVKFGVYDTVGKEVQEYTF
jgi:hypothetical protein